MVEPDLCRVSDAPEISVLLPVYDAERTLATCLTSLLRQREARWECVLIDDGSRDASRDIASSFAARDARIRVISRPHRGLIETLNFGLDACRAPFIARMDSDDWMHRDRLMLQREALARDPALAAAGCRVRLFPRHPRPVDSERRVRDDGSLVRSGRRSYEAWLNSIRTPEDVAREAFVECPIAHPTLFARREILVQYRYRDEGWPEDYDLILRLLADGHRLAVHPRRLLGWRDAPGRLSRASERYDPTQFTACKAAFLAMRFLSDGADYILWGYGDTGRALRKALLTHGKRPSHIVELHPRRIGQQIHGARVIAPDELRGLAVRHPLVTSVAGVKPRTEIRAALVALGLREGRDFVCAA